MRTQRRTHINGPKKNPETDARESPYDILKTNLNAI